MTVNYLAIGSVALVVILVLIFAIYKNNKDKEKLVDTLNKDELTTEHHKDGESSH